MLTNIARTAEEGNRIGPTDAPDLEAIPTDYINRALVVTPTISRRKHSKSNSARIGKQVLVWGTRGRRFESCLPDSQPIAV